MHYVLKNDKQDGMGAAPLPYGKVRIFIAAGPKDADQSTTFLGEDWGKFTPIDDEMQLYLGVAQDIVVRRTIDKNENHRIAGNLSDQEVTVKYEIENFKEQAVTLDVRENLRHLRDQLAWGQRPRCAMGAGQGHHVRCPRSRQEHVRAASVSRETAAPQPRWQSGEDRRETQRHPQE